MDSTPIKATVAQVPFGNIEIEGLMDEQGCYYVALPQLTDIDLISPNRSSKQLEALLNSGFQSHVNLTFVKLKTALHPKAINALALRDFEVLLARLDRKGNVKAQELRDAFVGLSLHQLFSDAFNVKFEQEERQEFVKVRQSTLVTRRELTDAIQSYIERHPELSDNYRKFLYSNTADCLNRGLFQKSSKQLCEERNCSSQHLRNSFSVDELRMIEHHESYAVQIIDKDDTEPMTAVKKALLFYA